MERIIIEVSRRHAHLSLEDATVLFGPAYALRVRNILSQPGQFAALETVMARSRGRILEHIRVVGPFRQETQLELSASDAQALDVNPPRRISGDTHKAETVELVGPLGSVMAPVILAQRHLHCDPQTAATWGLSAGERVRVRPDGARSLIDDLAVRIHPEAVVAVHIDEDEAREFGIIKKAWGSIVR